MDERTMPLATFGCDTCGEQVTVRLEYHLRQDGKPDRTRPHPRCGCDPDQPMRIRQIDYAR